MEEKTKKKKKKRSKKPRGRRQQVQSKTHPFVVVKPENCNIESLRLPVRHANVKKTWKTVRECNVINKSSREKGPLPEEEEKWSKRGIQ